MATKARKNYKKAYEQLVEAIRFDAMVFRVQVENCSDDDQRTRYWGMLSECESLLEQSEKFEAECMGQVNENGRISLHLYDRASETYVYDLDCNVGEMPERVWCEYLYTPFGNGYDISSQQDHMHNVRVNRENGLSLDAVWPSYSFCWVNDHDRIVDGPKVWAARYTGKVIRGMTLSFR